MPNRIIHERATTSETLAALDDGTERHFWRLIVQADDYGYLDARAEVIRARAYPMMLSKVTELESERRTQALTAVNLLHLFTVDGKRYGHFPTWDRYQRMRSKYRKFPQVTSCDVMCRQPTTIDGIGMALNENPYPIRESLQDSRSEKGDAADAAPLLQLPAQPLQEKKPWEPPEFYRALTLLDGYSHRDHSRAAAVVEAACKDAGVDPKVVVDHFAADYPTLKHSYGWNDPAAALKGRPLAVAISQVKGGPNGRRPQGKDLHQMRRELENGADQGRPVRSI